MRQQQSVGSRVWELGCKVLEKLLNNGVFVSSWPRLQVKVRMSRGHNKAKDGGATASLSWAVIIVDTMAAMPTGLESQRTTCGRIGLKLQNLKAH